jgi:hypothetical protein
MRSEIQPALGANHFKAGNQPTPPERTGLLSTLRQADSGKFPLLLQMPDESPKMAKTNQAKNYAKMAKTKKIAS